MAPVQTSSLGRRTGCSPPVTRVAPSTAASSAPSREPARTPAPPRAHSSSRRPLLAAPARIAPPCTPLRCSTNTLAMSVGTSFPAVWFSSAATPLTRRLLVYFDSGAYRSADRGLIEARSGEPASLLLNQIPRSADRGGLIEASRSESFSCSQKHRFKRLIQSSALAALCQQHFGAPAESDWLPANFASTANALDPSVAHVPPDRGFHQQEFEPGRGMAENGGKWQGFDYRSSAQESCKGLIVTGFFSFR